MVIKFKTLTFCGCIFIMFFSVVAKAALLSCLDGQAVYDTELDIT